MKNKGVVLFFLILFVLIFSTYSPALSTFFMADDAIWLLQGSDLSHVFEPVRAYLRPASVFYFYVMRRVFNLSPMPYHFVNILGHFLNAVLFYFFAKELQRFFQRDDETSGSRLFPMLSGFLIAVPLCAFPPMLWVSWCFVISHRFFS